jgi:hypothetical protein
VELLSVHPTAAIEEVAPTTSQPAAAPQERDAPEGEARATSPKIQEIGEGTSTTLLWDAKDGNAWILDLAQVPWAAAFEVSDDAGEDEESAVRRTLERRLTWARRAFDELILPPTSVSFLCVTLKDRYGEPERGGE